MITLSFHGLLNYGYNIGTTNRKGCMTNCTLLDSSLRCAPFGMTMVTVEGESGIWMVLAKTAPSIFRSPYPLKKSVIPNDSEESIKKYNSLVNIA